MIHQSKSTNTPVFGVHTRINPMRTAKVGMWLSALVLVVVSAIWTKEHAVLPALAVVDSRAQIETVALENPGALESTTITEPSRNDELIEQFIAEQDAQAQPADEGFDDSVRWFDGRPARPAKVIYMTVTGYSPDARSCGEFADGKTATMYSVWTNGMNLVAADPRVLPYWSMVSIPGYADGEIVPVLDCGGAIKGNRIDLLYPTHEIARKWGVRQVPVTVWEYIDED
ncbi:MAG: 3D domain-containing protein [Phycisphaerales bacterium]|nr:3D domain-containing protein [Phycisphaerales bacterium]